MGGQWRRVSRCQVKAGDCYHFLAEEALGERGENGKLRFPNNPATSKNTQLIAAAVTCGFRLADQGGFRDTIEETDKGPLRRVEWMIDGSSRGQFRTVKQGVEEIEFPEFRERYESDEWCHENPDHPITHLAWGFRAHSLYVDSVKVSKPCALIRKGNQTAIIHPDLPEEKKRKLLSFFK